MHSAITIGAGIVVHWAKLSLGVLATCVRGPGDSLPLLLTQRPLNAHPGRQQVMVQVPGTLPITWETWMKFLTQSKLL